MTKIKFCGLSRPCDIQAVNALKPEYIGFVFAPQSRRYISPEKASELKSLLCPEIKAVGVFVNENPKTVAGLLDRGIVDLAQLHGEETEDCIKELRALCNRPIIRAFRIRTAEDVRAAEKSAADFLLFDSGSGGGTVFDWSLIKQIKRPYFLAGGLDIHNVEDAVRLLDPYAVDVSSGIETNGFKDRTKMGKFISAVRKEKTQ